MYYSLIYGNKYYKIIYSTKINNIYSKDTELDTWLFKTNHFSAKDTYFHINLFMR